MAIRDFFGSHEPDTALIIVTEMWSDPDTYRQIRKTHKFAVEVGRGQVRSAAKLKKIGEQIAFGQLGKFHELTIEVRGIEGKTGFPTIASSHYVPRVPEGYTRIERVKAKSDKGKRIAEKTVRGGAKAADALVSSGATVSRGVGKFFEYVDSLDLDDEPKQRKRASSTSAPSSKASSSKKSPSKKSREPMNRRRK